MNMPFDKWLHHLAGAAIVIVTYLLARYLGSGSGTALTMAVTLNLGVACTKECVDAADPNHTVDWLDAGATIAGGAYATVLLLAFEKIEFGA